MQYILNFIFWENKFTFSHIILYTSELNYSLSNLSKAHLKAPKPASSANSAKLFSF